MRLRIDGSGQGEEGEPPGCSPYSPLKERTRLTPHRAREIYVTMARVKKPKIETLRLQAVELRAEGMGYEDIAQRLGLEVQDIIDTLQEGETGEKVSTLRAVKLEKIITAGGVDTTGRIKSLSSLRQRLTEELESRDLSDIPTKDLATLIVKINEALKSEVYTPKILTREEQLDRCTALPWKLS